MTKQAHITSRPGVEVGERTLGLCGKDFKVKVLWADLPDDKPICRECVDVALVAMTEADGAIGQARRAARAATTRLVMINEALTDDLLLDQIADEADTFETERAEKAERKAEAKRAKSTCTCEWQSQDTFVEDPNCPIHAEQQDD